MNFCAYFIFKIKNIFFISFLILFIKKIHYLKIFFKKIIKENYHFVFLN
jgi:hypothetical protein